MNNSKAQPRAKCMRMIARVLLLVMSYELIYPNVTYALTTGPSQPEVQSFEPVGTSDMVDMFSGDFVYNIPLLDVEGYPVNISYHGGVSMEQEASWVGLGWNINPGAINRSMRGVPDDFKGDSLRKAFHIKDEKPLRIGMGVTAEFIGVGDPLIGINLQVGGNINISNYRGVGVDFSFGAGVNVFKCVSAGVNIGVGSQTGAEIDYNAGLQLSTSQIMSSDMSGGIGVSYGQGYSTRSGLKDASFSISTSVSTKYGSGSGPSVSGTVPISLKNYVPVITNSSTASSFYGRLKIGAEVAWCNIDGYITGMTSIVQHKNDGSRKSYGYLYYQDASNTKEDILDFTRDRDGMFNKSMQYLPPGNMTYDVYAVAGQGTGGVFRPFRNDFGSVYDPVVQSNTIAGTTQIEASMGWAFALGGDGSMSTTTIKSGPWRTYANDFTGKTLGSIYEDVYFKQGGELTVTDPGYMSAIGGKGAISGNKTDHLTTKPGSGAGRDPRANFVSYFTAAEAEVYGVASSRKLYSFDTVFGSGPIKVIDSIQRYDATSRAFKRKKYHISEFVQRQTDGRTYIYGIPAMNNVTREATFSTDAQPNSKGLIKITTDEDGPGNGKGLDNYFSSTITPSYAHSYLLTNVLSADYVDVTGNGPTNDDLGSYTKFNYCLKDADYRWKAPVQTDSAQYNPGYLSDKQDDKANYVIGSREQWILTSIETKNFIAEFHTSARDDGKGAKDAIKGAEGFTSALSTSGNSYKLDEIVLYNKHDRFINTTNAVPVKTIYFKYDYTLCGNLPVESAASGGKLTLRRIFIKYGNSDKGMISPYQFEYNDTEPLNPNYNYGDKDRWGNYKPSDSILTNFLFPFVKQDPVTDDYAKAWSLNKVILPSGGTIEVAYESDDYAYVQDKVAMEMFKVEGLGNGPSKQTLSALYKDKHSPNRYVYFKRRPGDELSFSNFKDKYLNGADCIYFNFNVDLGDRKYEQIKGYAEFEEVGICTNNSQYGYVKLKPTKPSYGNATLHPATYTALNIGRYNLPHVFFPGSDPDRSDMQNVLAGMKQSFDELFSMGKNPIIRFVEDGRAQYINSALSYIRLNNPSMRKKGGGQRVKTLEFSDSWAAQAGGSNNSASYGKNYDYTITEGSYGNISSGVASYEPQIGGDENPYRVPVKFTVQNGSKWPPNDPVDLYQETPVAESLLPSPVVGYRKITVTSIHKAIGRSSQGIDIYQFYTAKDFPFIVQATALDKLVDENKFSLFKQRNTLEVTQGYTIMLNDMHGKPRSIEHYVEKSSQKELINSQVFEYFSKGKQLNNTVPTLSYERPNYKMKKDSMQLGVEADLTIDTREKLEETDNKTLNLNLNVTNLAIGVIPIPFGFPWEGNYKNEFRSVVATKIIQQYGIIKSVKTFNEGALTDLRNEFFDPNTGQAVITSVNNEFTDLEYNVNYPAYWGTKTMGPSYVNVGFADKADSLMIGSDYTATINKPSTALYYRIGDELLLTLSNGTTINAWVMGLRWGGNGRCCLPYIKPRYPNNTSGWSANNKIYNVQLKVVRSGNKNLLSESMQSYTTMKLPFYTSSGQVYLSDTLKDLISISGRYFADSPSVNIPTQTDPDTLNEFVKGQKGLFRLMEEWEYVQNRDYAGNSMRKTGLFSALSLWRMITSFEPCNLEYCDKIEGRLSYMYFNSGINEGWRNMRTVTAWNPFGMEIENKDAVNIFSTATYGYNEDLPVSLASNARQGEILAEGFEDYKLLLLTNSLMQFLYSPFKKLFSPSAIGSSAYSKYNVAGTSTTVAVVDSLSHSGINCFKTGNTTSTFKIPVISNATTTNQYRSFTLRNAPASGQKRKYLLSYWTRPASLSGTETTYNIAAAPAVSYSSLNFYPAPVTNIIDKWQKAECVFEVNYTIDTVLLKFPASVFIDDIRIHPYDANMKAFVYHPFNEKLMATLDENNFATFYEYDQEGNLIRTKKETEKGIMTVSESRSAHPKKQ